MYIIPENRGCHIHNTIYVIYQKTEDVTREDGLPSLGNVDRNVIETSPMAGLGFGLPVSRCPKP